MLDLASPETIDIGSLPWMLLDDKRLLPVCPAIYFALGADGAVLYIGRTIALQRRWMGHNMLGELPYYGGIRIAWLAVGDTSCLVPLEKACIAYFKPILNGPSSRQARRLWYASAAQYSRELRRAAHIQRYGNDKFFRS